ncbi:hypothetical protein A2U01_0087769, partial [Trifolium medium]|nr:hypothetical protein [Trifolium medium]
PQHHPHHIPQHGQYFEYELGIAAYNYNTAVMTRLATTTIWSRIDGCRSGV